MRKLEIIVEDIKADLFAINRDVSLIPIAGRNGFIMQANQAKQNIKKLRLEYEETLLSKSIGFFLTGPVDKQQAFADLSIKLGKSVVVDNDLMYRGYATFLTPTIGHHKEFTINQLTKLDGLLQGTSDILGLDRSNYPEVMMPNGVNNYDELTAYVKKVVIKSNGYKITTPFLRNVIATKAFEGNFGNKVLTTVILNTDDRDQNNLNQIFTKSITVDLDQIEIAEEFVNKTIRDAFKKN
jgi:hypothetical protein